MGFGEIFSPKLGDHITIFTYLYTKNKRINNNKNIFNFNLQLAGDC